jgi:hypothetical protein
MWIIVIWSPHSSPKRLTHSFDPSNGSNQGPAPAFGPVLRVFIIPIVVLKFDERKAERTDDGDDDAGAVDDATVGVSLTGGKFDIPCSVIFEFDIPSPPAALI